MSIFFPPRSYGFDMVQPFKAIVLHKQCDVYYWDRWRVTIASFLFCLVVEKIASFTHNNQLDKKILISHHNLYNFSGGSFVNFKNKQSLQSKTRRLHLSSLNFISCWKSKLQYYKLINVLCKLLIIRGQSGGNQKGQAFRNDDVLHLLFFVTKF